MRRTLEVKISAVVQRRSIVRDFLSVTASVDKPAGVSSFRHNEGINKMQSLEKIVGVHEPERNSKSAGGDR